MTENEQLIADAKKRLAEAQTTLNLSKRFNTSPQVINSMMEKLMEGRQAKAATEAERILAEQAAASQEAERRAATEAERLAAEQAAQRAAAIQAQRAFDAQSASVQDQVQAAQEQQVSDNQAAQAYTQSQLGLAGLSYGGLGDAYKTSMEELQALQSDFGSLFADPNLTTASLPPASGYTNLFQDPIMGPPQYGYGYEALNQQYGIPMTGVKR